MRQSTMLATSFRRDIEIKLKALFDYVLKTDLSNVNERIFNHFTIDFFLPYRVLPAQ